MGATVFELNGTFSLFSDMPIMPLPFLPLLVLGVERAFAAAEQRKRSGWALIAISIAYSIYAGFPETAYLNGLLALAWSLYRLLSASPGSRMMFASKVASGGVCGILLALPIVLPFFEYLKIAGTEHGGLSNVGLAGIGLAGTLMPFVFGPIWVFNSHSEMLSGYWGSIGGYLDLVVLFIASLALWTSSRFVWLRILLFGWIALFLARTMGVPGVGKTLGLIPGMDSVAVFRYCQPSISFAASVLVAFTLQAWGGASRKGDSLSRSRIELVTSCNPRWLFPLVSS